MHNINLQEYSTLIFDFDGVFTDNKVYMDQNGIETVQFSRGDGFAINLLQKAKRKRLHNLNYFVLSTEKNPIVTLRCEKMNLPCVQGVVDKYNYLIEQSTDNEQSHKIEFKKLIYVGNDLNDLQIMMKAGLTLCPNDAHPLIKSVSSYISKRDGGQDFVREVIEILLGFEQSGIEEINELILNS
jgi:N-acylneuraminate cytidylyltransferase